MAGIIMSKLKDGNYKEMVLIKPKLKHEWILCGYTAEKVICDVNCVDCCPSKREQAIKKFKERYYVKKGKVLSIRQNTERKGSV